MLELGRPRRGAKREHGATFGVAGPIHLAIVSSERLIREALAVLVRSDDGIDVVDEAEGGEHRAHVILLDMPATASEGIEVLAALRRTSPSARVLLLMDTSDESLVVTALTTGAKGCVSRKAGGSELRKAIRGVHRGEIWATRGTLVRCLGGQNVPVAVPAGGALKRRALTAREGEVLRALTSGATNKEIACALVISEKTVKSHLGSVFRKLQVTGRFQAALHAIRQGLH